MRMSVSALEALADDGGQSSMDFIFGFAVFLLVFIFAISFVAGLFTPFQPGAIDLSSVAYRTSTILVEDPGWYVYAGADGHLVGDSSWEAVATGAMGALPSLRVGLADDKASPNVLSMDKVDALKSLAVANYTMARDCMGLKSSSSIVYDVKLSLDMENGFNGTRVQLMATDCPNATAGETETIERNVLVDCGRYLFVDAGTPNPYGGASSVLQVDIQNVTTRKDGLKIAFYNNITANTPGRITGVGIFTASGTVPLIVDDGYSVKLNGNEVHSGTFDVHKGDLVEIVVFSSAVQDTTITHVNIKADGALGNLFPTSYVNYAEDKVYAMKSICHPGTFRLEVWSNEYY